MLAARHKREARAAALAAQSVPAEGGVSGGYGAVLRLAQTHSVQARALAEQHWEELKGWAPDVPRSGLAGASGLALNPTTERATWNRNWILFLFFLTGKSRRRQDIWAIRFHAAA